MYIVGLDLSTVSTGLVIIKQYKTLDRVHKAYTFTAKNKDVHQRIYEIVHEVRSVLSRIKSSVDIVVIEAVYNIKWNTQSLLEIRGAIINVLIELGLKYEIISASEARKITNAIPYAQKGKPWTREQKKQFVKVLVEKYYHVKFKNDDESDAALLCLAWITQEEKK